ncbi:MAG: hypothetical protein MMC33_001351 [Icmadophila ericetorum]|nr:hypothetical protein [Icmadophila ericetorum]
MANFVESAIAHIAKRGFHRSYVVPSDPAVQRHDPIRIMYADNDYRENPNGPVLLFIGGIFGTRNAVTGEIDALARHYKLRLIAPDKCGFEGTGRGNTNDRIRTWVDLVADLLKHLNIKYVAMASHSAGTMYLFHMILLRSLIPNALIANWSSIVKKTIPSINKALNFSSALMKPSSREKPDQEGREEDLPEGITVEAHAMQSESLETNRAPILTPAEPEQRQTLKVRVYFADGDGLVGLKGAGWFEKCWQQPGVSEAVDYRSEAVPNSVHENIVDSEKGIIAEIFDATVRSFEEC